MKPKKTTTDPVIISTQVPPLAQRAKSTDFDVRGGEGEVTESNHVLIQSLQDQVSSTETNWKRALADYQNLVKRVESDKKDFVTYATANLVSKFLPSLDILKLAATHSSDPGVKMAVNQLHDVLISEGLEVIDPQLGDTYNHTLHECVETLTGGPENAVAEILSKGYKIEDFIIRPARVKVYKNEIQNSNDQINSNV